MHELPDDIPLMRHMLGEPNEQIDLALATDAVFLQHYEALREKWTASGLLGAAATMDVEAQWQQFKRRRHKRTWPAVLKIAAAITGTALLTALLWREPERHPLVYHSMPPGKQGLVVLPDSTKVWLNAGSDIVYDEDARTVRLQGEAYFDVQADPQHPFYVHAGNVKVEVLGTRFNLMAYSGDSLVSTSLLQGSVRLHSGKDTLLIRPGQKAVWHQQQQAFKTTDTGTETDTRWKDGEMVFRKEPLDRAFAALERWFGAKVAYDPQSFAGHHITARLEKGETLERTFMLLREILPMDYSIRNNVVYVRHK